MKHVRSLSLWAQGNARLGGGILATILLAVVLVVSTRGNEGVQAAVPVAPAAPVSTTPSALADPEPALTAESATSPAAAKDAARAVVTAIEACYAAQGSYAQCWRPEAIGSIDYEVIVGKRPGPGQIAVVSSAPETYKIVATAEGGDRYIVSKNAKGKVKRRCALAGGDNCTPLTW